LLSNLFSYIMRIQFKISLLILLYQIPEYKLEAQVWNSLGNGTPSPIYSFGEYNGKLVIGCTGPIGGIGNGMATWDGLSWDSLGIGTIYGTVKCFENYNNELIAAGNFSDMGNFTYWIPNTRSIAAWNGTQWHALGTGGNNSGFGVNALAVYNGELYAGGYFIDMGGVSCNRIARWNGLNWNTVGTGLTAGMPVVYSMCIYNGELYVGGTFQMAGGMPASGIARWNGTQWHSVGGGFYGFPTKMIVDTTHNLLVLGGNMSFPDTSFGWGICAWDGNNFLPYGNGLGHAALSIAIYKNYLFTAGPGATGSVYDTTLEYWDSTSWKPILGPNNALQALATYQNELYIGGAFTLIDTLNISYVTRYSNLTLNIADPLPKKEQLLIYPNPTKSSVNIYYSFNEKSKNSYLRVYDTTGKIRLTKRINDTSGVLQIGEGLLAKGIYIVKLSNKSENINGKFVIE
jgi:hypothetical protein